MVGIYQTDEMGQSPAITLPAPALEYSMEPESGRPFYQYNMEVVKTGESETFVEHVQIYPDVVALQKVILKHQPQDVFVPYPTLWGDFPPKIPEQ